MIWGLEKREILWLPVRNSQRERLKNKYLELLLSIVVNFQSPLSTLHCVCKFLPYLHMQFGGTSYD